MKIHHNYSLQAFNTLGFSCLASHFIDIQNIDEFNNQEFKQILNFYQQQNKRIIILGCGSNIILQNSIFDGLVIHISANKIQQINTDSLIVDAGYIWHNFVQFCLNNNYHGLENLALIPGTVGASPVQNIGAYGVEVSDYIESIEVFNLKTKIFAIITNEQCNFKYRDSLFKKDNSLIILRVRFKFNQNYLPNTDYKELSNYLQTYNLERKPQNIFSAIINIRNRKLPDPKILANVGSFFKNPIISLHDKQNLENKFPDLISYNQGDGNYKIAAGWLIQKMGFKGFKYNNVGVYEKQALVLVNYSSHYADEILQLANIIKSSALQKFGLNLEIEPLLI